MCEKNGDINFDYSFLLASNLIICYKNFGNNEIKNIEEFEKK